MSERKGLISHESADGLLHVFVPGKHVDLKMGQQKTASGEKLFRIGDFIKFFEINGSITSPSRLESLLETRIKNQKLQVKLPVAFPPLWYSACAEFTAGMLAWSPDFIYVGCFHNITPKPRRNWIYMAWVERVPHMMQVVAGISVAWHIVDDFLEACDGQAKRLITKTPWYKKSYIQLPSQLSQNQQCQQSQRSWRLNQRPSMALLKACTDNYEGLVTSVYESSARIWSLAIPETEVLFLYGAREGMKIGDWVHFNCEAISRPQMNCYLLGKKYKIIEPVLPAKAYNNTILVEVFTNVWSHCVKYYPTGEVTVETEVLGRVEFKPGKFRQTFCGKRLRMAVYKDMPSIRTGAIWRFFAVAVKELPSNEMEFGNYLCSWEDSSTSGGMKFLYGVIINNHQHHKYIWTKEVGEVLWEIESDASNKYHLGLWLEFNAVPLVPHFKTCAYAVQGGPKVVLPIRETRVVNKVCQIKTKIECDKSCHSDVCTAHCEELGFIWIPESISQCIRNVCHDRMGDCLSGLVVWVKRRFDEMYQWEVDEVVKESKLQHPISGGISSGTPQHEVNSDLYTDFFDETTFTNHKRKTVKLVEEYDPLKVPVFGGTRPHFLSSKVPATSNSRKESKKPGHLNITYDQKFSDNLLKAREYLLRIWHMPEIRQHIAERDEMFFAEVMQFMTDMGIELAENGPH